MTKTNKAQVSAEFKAKVALEAIKNQKTLDQLSRQVKTYPPYIPTAIYTPRNHRVIKGHQRGQPINKPSQTNWIYGGYISYR